MIELKNLRLNVGTHEIVSQENIQFPDGTMTFIKGPSGSGKTTLLYILGLLSKQDHYIYISDGEIIKTQTEKDTERKNNIGMMYQNFNLLEHLSLYDNIKLFSDMNSIKITRQETISLLNQLGLNLPLDRKFESLSGGEKQRFCLACLLAKKPNVIIADEPTSALDQQNADLLMEKLFKLAKEEGKTVIVSTHASEYDYLSDNIINITKNGLSQTNPLPKLTVSPTKRIYKKVNPSFYLEMLKHRLTHMIRHNWLVTIFTILAICLSAFLYQYSSVGKEEYSYYMNTSLKNEAYLSTTNSQAVLSDEELDYILNIPGISDVSSIKLVNGDVTLPSGEKINGIQIYSLASFQSDLSDNECIGDISFYHQIGNTIRISSGDVEKEYKISSTYTNNKTSLYSQGDIQKIFLPEEEIMMFDFFETNQYVLNIDNFNQYDNIVSKISLLNSDYTVSSSYHHFSMLLENLKQQQTLIKFTTIILIAVSFLLFCMVQIQEINGKRKEMCIYQANGLGKKHVLLLEVLEFLCKMIIFYVLCVLFSLMIIYVVNTTILEVISIVMNLEYLLILLVLLIAYIFIPTIFTVLYFLKQSPEDELRAIA